MFSNRYKIKISCKYPKTFIKYLYKNGISFHYLDIYENYFIAILDYKEFKKLKDIKTHYDISIIKLYGLSYGKYLIFSNLIFIISFFFSILLLFLLSNIIFDVSIISDDSLLKNKLYQILDEYDIKEYSFVKSYDYLYKVKKDILDKYNNLFDWIEIENKGSKYIVKFEKRTINENKNISNIRHVVAKKNGIIKKIYSEKGEIVKKINDYVSKGDIIISGEIHKGEDVLDNVAADGNIYAEVWYDVKVTLPIKYYEKKLLDGENKYIEFSFLDNSLFFFKSNFKYSDVNKINIYSDFFDMFNINYNLEHEVYINDSLNTIMNENIAVNYAAMKINSQLSDDEHIISQKKLKTILNDSTIVIEVFFKVYEDISEYKEYGIDKGM